MTSILVGTALLVMAIVNAFLMLEALAAKHQGSTFFVWHRRLGAIFVIVFLGIFFLMLPRAAFLRDMPVSALTHALAGLALLPLVLCKLLVARRYRLYKAALPSLGFLIVFFCYITMAMSGVLVMLFKVSD